jgi:aminotransferase
MTHRPPPARLGALPEQYFTTILAAAARARAQPGAPFIDLGRGNPDLPPPDHAIAALRAAALETATPLVHGYPPFDGHADLRAAIAERSRADHGVELDPDREVAVLPGTKTGIMLACLATAERGSPILLPDPGYPDYLSARRWPARGSRRCASTRRPASSPTSTPRPATRRTRRSPS